MLNLGQVPTAFDYFHLTAEFAYEFVKGTRMSDSDNLSRCEQNITDFEIQYQAALEYTREGIRAQDFNV